MRYEYEYKIRDAVRLGFKVLLTKSVKGSQYLSP